MSAYPYFVARKPRDETKERKAEYLDQMRQQLTPGTTVWTVLRDVSSSGMGRSIDLFTLPAKDQKEWWSYRVAAVLGERWDDRREAVRVTGAGMDMGFHLVYSLSQHLYPNGFDCIGEDCPSNDHANGDRDYSPHHHANGGYALQHRWL